MADKKKAARMATGGLEKVGQFECLPDFQNSPTPPDLQALALRRRFKLGPALGAALASLIYGRAPA